MAKDKELSTDELAERWEMHPQTLRNWRAQKRGPRFYKKGRHKTAPVIYKMKDVIHFEKFYFDTEILVETSNA